MKHSSFILPTLGILIGFVIGYAIKGNHDLQSSSTRANETIQSIRQLAPTNSHDAALLEQTTAELAKATARIHTLEHKAARYDKTAELWKEFGFGASTPLIFRHEGLIPSDALINYFEWDESTVDAINKIGETTERAILEWEMGSAHCAENTADRRVFEIPEAPAEIRDQYRTSLESIIGKEDTDLVILEVNRTLDQYLSRRTVIFTRVPEPTVSDQGITVGGFSASIQNPAFIGIEIKGYRGIGIDDEAEYGNDGLFFTSRGKMDYNPNTPTYDRWNHLLRQNPFQNGM